MSLSNSGDEIIVRLGSTTIHEVWYSSAFPFVAGASWC
jgi:hypothetical protein